jgi:XTP/dITP diphosphohydrolase
VRKIVLASRNKGKIQEIKDLLASLSALPMEVTGLGEYPGAPEVAETGKTFLENAVLKAKAIAEFTHELTLADDSGLEVDYLNGEPGVYSARYGEPGWDDRKRYEYLLHNLKNVPESRRNARFRCVVAVYDPASNRVITGEGKIEGIILEEPIGTNGFGYDPVFYIPDKSRTMAQLSDAEKNAISHRGEAIRDIITKLNAIL